MFPARLLGLPLETTQPYSSLRMSTSLHFGPLTRDKLAKGSRRRIGSATPLTPCATRLRSWDLKSSNTQDKHARQQPHVRITPSDSRGKSLGPWLDARAFVTDDPAEVKRVADAFGQKYGLQKRFFELLSRLRGGAVTGTVRIDLNVAEE